MRFSPAVLAAKAAAVVDLSSVWPVDSIYLSMRSENPALALGFGTWQALGAGRVLIGVDAGDAQFNASGLTGGAKSHVLTESQLPVVTVTQQAHNHVQDPHNHTQQQHSHPMPVGATDDTAAPFERADAGANASGANAATATGPTTALNNQTTAVNQPATAICNPFGGGQAHPNLPPYLTCFMWLRVA